MSRTSIILILLLFFSLSFVYSQQSLQEWQKKQQEEFDKFKNTERQKFQQFRDKRDSAFVQFLKKEWLAMQLTQGFIPDRTPKPVDLPVTRPQAIPASAFIEPAKTINAIQVPMPPIEKPAESLESLLAKFKGEGEPLTWTFFDALLKVNYDKAIKEAKAESPINETHISDFWADLSRSRYDDLLDQLKALKEQMKLNDWGFCLLLNRIAQELYPGDKNRNKLFVWFMLLKSSYDVKVGYDDHEVHLLIPAKNVIYGSPYFDMAGKKYFVVSFDNLKNHSKSVQTYRGDYPDAQKLVSLDIKICPAIRQAKEEKQLRFNYYDKEFVISVALKKDALDFYKEYPQTDYQVYFDGSLSPEAQQSLLTALTTIIKGKSEVEAANILLRFVQTAFEYKNDESQFGREKPFFAEETLFYPFSDCEDRSVLFAYLVRNLLGLDVVGLDYPGHIATAVRFSTAVKGDFFEYNGNQYIICDATFINANIGQCMPRFKGINPKAISLYVR